MKKTTARIPDPPITDDGFRLTDLLSDVQCAIECANGPDKHLVKWDGNAYFIARLGLFEIRNWHKPFEIAEEHWRKGSGTMAVNIVRLELEAKNPFEATNTINPKDFSAFLNRMCKEFPKTYPKA